jgi:hypothetical protein
MFTDLPRFLRMEEWFLKIILILGIFISFINLDFLKSKGSRCLPPPPTKI